MANRSAHHRRAVTVLATLALLPGLCPAAPISALDGLHLRSWLDGLSNPVALRHAGDGSARLFVVQQNGLIRVVRNGAVLATPMLTLDASSTRCRARPDSTAPTAIEIDLGFSSGGERGLLGLDFHPDHAGDGRAFINFSDARGDTVVASYRPLAGDADRLDPDSCEIVLRVDQDFANHNGGDLHFGGDGYLYIGLGDGGSGNDPCNRARTLAPAQLSTAGSCAVDSDFTTTGGNAAGGNADSRALLGKFLRIDVNQPTAAAANGLCGAFADGSAAYSVPADNPYRGDDPASACDEVWSYGWRNPWRFSFDRDTDDLWVGDVGQNAVEEIDLEPAANGGGGDYGWKLCEGAQPANGGTCTGSIAPLLTYAHSDGRCSIAGGYRWRGRSAGFSEGRYFYADSCTSEMFVAELRLGEWSSTRWLPADAGLGAFGVVGFGEDESGGLYVIDLNGRIFRLESALFVDSFER